MRRLYTQKLTWENDFPVIEDPKPVDTVFTYAKNPRTVDSVISGFDKRGTVEYTPPAAPPYDVEFDDITPFVDKPVGGGLSALAIGLIAGGAALAAAGVAAGVVISKKKKKATAADVQLAKETAEKEAVTEEAAVQSDDKTE